MTKNSIRSHLRGTNHHFISALSKRFFRHQIHRNVFLITTFLFTSCYMFAQDQWLTAGHDLNNSHYAATEKKISPANVGGLQVKWVFNSAGDVSATPAVDNQFVYFPDWAGNLYKVNAETGAQVWAKAFKNFTGQDFAFARATPAISGNIIVIGTQLGTPAIGAFVLGINKTTGDLLWKTKVDDHFAAVVTQSAVIHGNAAYVGVASQEENFAADPGYPCCSFRGSILSIDINTGAINWKTYMSPAGKGFSGTAVWGSTPVVDLKRNSLYVSTGNNYTVPQHVLDCVAAGGSPAAVKACIMAADGSAQNYFDAIVSLDLKTGAVKWANSVIPFDAWTVSCFFGGPNCPDNAGPDYDFGQGPALFTVGKGNNKRQLLGAGQKSGIYWALNPDNGAIVWSTGVGPGGTLGGLQWGSAVDETQVYTAVSNNYYLPHLMSKGPGAGNTVNGGFWAALNAETGELKWEYAASNPPVPIPLFPPPAPGSVATNTGMMSVANGVVFGAAMDAAGTMYAFDAATGNKLWSFESGGTVNAGAAIVNGSVYWGSGYANFGLGTPNHKLFAFALPGKHAMQNNPVTSIQKFAAPSINVYPTPAKDVIKIESLDNSAILSVRLYDLNGKLVKDFKPTGNSRFQVELRAISSGTYILNVVTATTNRTTKIIVAH